MSEVPKRNWPRLILFSLLTVSLLGNAATIGAALRLRSLTTEILGPSAPDVLYPASVREGLRAAVVSHSATLLPELRALLHSRERVIEAGLARPFDREAVLARMAEFHEQADDLLGKVQSLYLDELERQAQK
jgi:hypothetical protein